MGTQGTFKWCPGFFLIKLQDTTAKWLTGKQCVIDAYVILHCIAVMEGRKLNK